MDYTYDQAGFVTSTTYPGGTVIGRTNTAGGQIATLVRGAATLVDYAYVGSRAARREYPVPAMATVYSHDNLGRVTGVDAGAGVVQFTYTYEPDENNIDTKTFHHRDPVVANDYEYDDLDRLTDVEYLGNPSDVEVFAMDDLGNRTGQVTQRDGTHTYSVDSLTNRYTQIDAATIEHDAAGNLERDRQGYWYQYDYENRIIRIFKLQEQTEVTVATFEYDALGRRIRKVDAVMSVTTLYYYDPDWRCLEERDGSDTLQRSFIYGNYIDEVLVMTVPGSPPTDYYYLHDHLYSPAALLAANGSVVERYEYDAYGTVHVFDGSWNTRSASACGNPYTFTGRRLDLLDSGALEVMYYRYRYYDAFAGRFLHGDPLGYVDGPNLYEYLSSRPVHDQDPFGLVPCWASGLPTDPRHKEELLNVPYAVQLQIASKFHRAQYVEDWQYGEGTRDTPHVNTRFAASQYYEQAKELRAITETRLQKWSTEACTNCCSLWRCRLHPARLLKLPIPGHARWKLAGRNPVRRRYWGDRNIGGEPFITGYALMEKAWAMNIELEQIHYYEYSVRISCSRECVGVFWTRETNCTVRGSSRFHRRFWAVDDTSSESVEVWYGTYSWMLRDSDMCYPP